MSRDINKTQEATISENVLFEKQQVRKVSILKRSDGVTLSGDIRLYSDSHDHEDCDVVRFIISEHESSDGEDVPALTVSKVLTALQSYQGEPVDLTKLTIDDFLASIIHERTAE